MERFFNTAGPCEPGRHYMLAPLRRLPDVGRYVERGLYFVLHAARQVGKTTALRALAKELTAQGRYVSVALTLETGDPFPDDVAMAEDAILSAWRDRAMASASAELQPPPWPVAPAGGRIGAALAAWSRAAPRPLVLLLDEIDALQEDALRSVLRQLRAGFPDRPASFPWALCLCGVRDVRDYKIRSGGQPRLGSASPFNVKSESLLLRGFTEDEVAELYQQHTSDTGQPFTKEAVARAFALTCGQPWLVNALADQATSNLVPDRGQPITADHIEQAREILILRRDTHLDSLAEKLHEERVRRVIEPILVGTTAPLDILNDDVLYVRDLGLIAPSSPVRIANPIYQEIIPRSLSYVAQEYLQQDATWYRRPDGTLDMVLLLAAFQEFFAEHSEAWLSRFDYQEAGPHLLLMAFLQRVVNGGGSIRREFAVGSGRADLVVEVGGARSVLELKLRTGPATVREGLAQLDRYLDRLGEPEGFLVLFDRRPAVPWADKLQLYEAATPALRRVYVFCM